MDNALSVFPKKGKTVRAAKVIILALVLIPFYRLPASGWDPFDVPQGFTVADPGAPVELEGRVLFIIHLNFKYLTAQKRAQIVEDRILKLAQNPLFNLKTITVQDSELSSDIMAGDQILFPIWQFEAKLEGRSAPDLARDYADKIRRAIEAYQEEHSLRNLLIDIAKTLLVSLALIVLIMLVIRGARRLNQVVLASDRVRSIKLGEFEFFNAERIKAVIISIVKVMRLLAILMLIYVYVHLGLSFYPATQRYALALYSGVLGAINVMADAIWRQTPDLAFLAVLFLITRYVLKTLHFFFAQVGEGQVRVPWFDAEVAPTTYRILKVLILAFVAVIAYPYIPGSTSPAFKGISIFLGVLLSLGSSSAVASVIAGVSLTYMRSFRVGDVIKVGDSIGVVVERKLNITRIKTFKKLTITIPNLTILSSHITNFSQEVRDGNGVILHTSMTIGYDVPWEKIHALLIEAGNRTAHVLKSPPPFVLQTALNDFYVSYELNIYTNTPEILPRIYSELHQNIQNTFNEAGVEIMSPHYTQIRDGNQTTIPEDYLPSNYVVPSIRVAMRRDKKEPEMKSPAEPDDRIRLADKE